MVASAAAAAVLAQCRPEQLRAAATFYGEAGGSFVQTLTFTNQSRDACRLRGWPKVNLPSRRVIQGAATARPFVTVVLRSGAQASFDVYGEDWNHRANRPCPEATSLSITLPGARAALPVRVRIPRCGLLDIAPLIAGRADRRAWSVAVATVIPWLPRRPARVSANPTLAPACRADDLRAHLALQGATGSLVGGIGLRNTGAAPCSLSGSPHLSIIGAHGARWQLKRLGRSPQPLDVLADPPGSLRALAPGKSAGVAVFWSNWCGSRPPRAFVLALAGNTQLVVPVSSAPRCDQPSAVSLLEVAPFTPAARHLPASSRLPLAVKIVGTRPVPVKPGVRAFRVRRGEVLRFRVAVTNTGKAPFRFAPSSCPVYVEQLDVSPQQVYVLNCRPAGELPTQGAVQFAMQVAIPPGARLGLHDLTWQLAPRTYDAPFAPAAIWVVP